MQSGSWKAEAALGGLVVAVLAAFIWLTFELGQGAPRNASRYTLLLDSALGLSEDNLVAIAGVKVGIVSEIGIEGRAAKVVVSIDPGVQLHQNARAAVRQKTLLGEKYIDLDPGQAPAPVLASGSVLAENEPTVEIDEVIRATAHLVKSLNVIAPPLESAVAQMDKMLQGQDGEQVTRELASTLADVRVLIQETSKVVQASSGDVRVLLSVAREKGPSVLDKIDSASGRLDALLAAVDPARIDQIAADLQPAAANVETMTGDMRLAMADLRGAAKRLDTVLSRVDSTLVRLDKVNERSIREFFQIEGLRMNLIPDANVTNRVKQLRNEPTTLPD